MKKKKSVILFIILFLSPFTIGSMIWMFSTSDLFVLKNIIRLHIINGSVAFVTAPLACMKIVSRQIKKSSQFIILNIFVVVALFSLFANLYIDNVLIGTITLILRFSGLLFIYIMLMMNRKFILVEEMKAFYNSMLITASVLLFILLFVISLRFMNHELYYFVRKLPMDQIFTIVLSFLISVFLIHIFIVPDSKPRSDRDFDHFNLTPREKEIITLILNGYTSKESSKLLSISQQTVKNHTANIYRKLKINSKMELYQMFFYP